MQTELVRIGELARRAGVSIATLKHYLREGLIQPARKTGRTMSWYDPALVGQIQAIKDLQRTRFMPLDVIRDALDRDATAEDDLAAAEAIAGVLARRTGGRALTRAELCARGARPEELDWLAAARLAVPSAKDGKYRGDDLALLSTLGAARKAGLSAEMLPFDILAEYLAALRALVAVELRMFRAGVLGRGHGPEVVRLTTAATQLSERLVVLIRRRLLVPTLRQLMKEDPDVAPARPSDPRPDRDPRRVRRQHAGGGRPAGQRGRPTRRRRGPGR